MVIDVLTRLVRQSNVQETSEAQALIALFSLLEGFTESQSEAVVETVSLEEGDLFSWPVAIQYLLTNYLQSPRIS